MKKLFLILVLAALGSVGLVSCKQDNVKLHPSVGEIYGSATSTMGGDGIIFYVNEAEGYALICSMTDVKNNRSSAEGSTLWKSDFTWGVFGTDTLMERDTVWGEINRDIRHYVGTEVVDSTLTNTIVAGKTEKFKKYIFEMKDSANIKVYPMLRYKARRENGQPVHPTITEPRSYLGYIGEDLSDTLLVSVKVEKFVNTNDKWPAGRIIVGSDTISLVTEKDTTYRTTDGNQISLYRPYADTVERRTRTFRVIRYVDTLWTYIKKGDRPVKTADGAWNHQLDTNWTYGWIGIGEEDPDGKINTMKIVNADVPCRQQIRPDSSSAARRCNEYFTRAYARSVEAYERDTTFKSSQGEWFLPSRAELRHLFNAKNKINEANANTKGFEPLQNCYWSSNERKAANAWYKCFSDNGVESYIPKANSEYKVNIRAVRKVKWPLK